LRKRKQRIATKFFHPHIGTRALNNTLLRVISVKTQPIQVHRYQVARSQGKIRYPRGQRQDLRSETPQATRFPAQQHAASSGHGNQDKQQIQME